MGKTEEVEGVAEIILVAKQIGGVLSEKGRVPVRLVGRDGQEEKYSLRLEDIREVWFDGNDYYIVYSTDHPDYYGGKYSTSGTVVGVKCKLVKRAFDVCGRCGRRIFWDADEPYCPGCQGWPKGIKTKYMVDFRYNWYELLKYWVEVATGHRLEDIGHFWANAAGGKHVKQLVEARELPSIEVLGREIKLVECKGFTVEESYWDWVGQVPEKKYDGHFIIATWYPPRSGWERVVYRVVE